MMISSQVANEALPVTFNQGLETEGMQELLASAVKCYLIPVRFFVSWHGVLTLVYRFAIAFAVCQLPCP